MSTPIYHLTLEMSGCLAAIRLNGFLLGGGSTLSMNPPVNPYLVGSGNVLEVDVAPLVTLARPDEPTTFADLRLSGSVREFQSGGIVGPGTGTVVTAIGVSEELRKQHDEEGIPLPTILSFAFDTASPSFNGCLTDAEAFDDAAGVMEYALSLRDLLAAGDADGLDREFSPKLDDYAAAYGDSPADVHDGWTDFLRGELFNSEPLVEFEAKELILVPTCGGRLWEVRRIAGGEPLFLTREDDEGSNYAIPIYVGRVDGGFKVVR